MMLNRSVHVLGGCMVLVMLPSVGSAADAKINGRVTLDGKPLGEVFRLFSTSTKASSSVRRRQKMGAIQSAGFE